MTEGRAQLLAAIKVAAGLVLASGGASIVFALLTGDIRFYPPTFTVVSAVSVVLGLPMYLVARSARKDTWRVAAVAGFGVGAVIPAAVILLGPKADEASVGGVATTVHGAYTAAGWLENLGVIGFFGLLGVGGALLFWLIAHKRSPSVAGDQRPSRAPTLKTGVLLAAALGAIGAVFVIPQATMDRSCHNTLRDGRTSIGAVANFNLKVGIDQWPDIAKEMQEFARMGGWSARSDVRTDPGFPWLQISLCKEPGTDFQAQGLAQWTAVEFSVYQPQGGSSWRGDFHKLYERISARWPDKIGFKDDQGNPSAPPEWTAVKSAP